MLRESTLEPTYSHTFSGETAKLCSSITMAPMKNSPMAAGSEKISTMATVSLYDRGREPSRVIYSAVRKTYSR